MPTFVVLHKAKTLLDAELRLVQKCVSIEKRLFPKHESLATTFELEARKQSQDFVVILDDNGTVLGYMIITRTGHISKIAIASDFQRQGYGRQLIAWAKKRHPVLTLHVDPNRPALSFYRSEQFQHVELIRDYYIVGRDACLMRWQRPP